MRCDGIVSLMWMWGFYTLCWAYKIIEVIAVLLGLNESFAQVRSVIIFNSIVSSVNQAYSMATQEQSQR